MILKCDHFFLCVCVGIFSVFCVLIILFKLWMIWNGKPLYLAMVQIVTQSCCLACSVIGVEHSVHVKICKLQVCVLMDGWT